MTASRLFDTFEYYFLQKSKKMFDRFLRHSQFGMGSNHTQKWWKALGKAMLNAGYLKEKQMRKGSFGSSVGRQIMQLIPSFLDFY